MSNWNPEIVVTFALRTESSGFIKSLGERQISRGKDTICGKIGTKAVGVFHTGVGAESCRPQINNLLADLQPELLISAGFAGSVSDQFKPGDLLLAENFSDENVLAKALQLLAHQGTRPANLFTARRIVDSAKERDEIARAQGADAVDMETEIIAAACAAHQVKMLSLRVISDSPSEPLPAPPQVLFDLQQQRTDFMKLAAYLLRHPQAVVPLLQFSRRVARARDRLTEAIVTLVQKL